MVPSKLFVSLFLYGAFQPFIGRLVPGSRAEIIDVFTAALLGIAGASFVWGATELKEQAVRAEIGWYPFNARKNLPPFAKIIEKWKAPHL